MIKSSNGDEDKLPCGHDPSKAWLVTAPHLLDPILEPLKPQVKVGIQLVQCGECKLMVNIRLTATPIEKPSIVVPGPRRVV